MNQKMKLIGLVFCGVFLLRGSNQITYKLRFEPNMDPLVLSEGVYNLMETAKFAVSNMDNYQNSDIIDILVKPHEQYHSHALFNSIVRPILLHYIDIKNSQEKKSNYEIICELIGKVSSGGTYEAFKDAFLLSGFLGLPNEIGRVFGNLCYDRQEKKRLDTDLTSEQQWVQTNLLLSDVLLSINDLPEVGKSRDGFDQLYTVVDLHQIFPAPYALFNFKNKRLRSLKGFNELITWLGDISDWWFDFSDNIIQEVDFLTDLYKNQAQNFQKNTIYLRNNNLSDDAKKICSDINAENKDSFSNPPKPAPKKIVIPLMVGEGLFYLGGSFAFTKLFTDKLLSSTQKFAPSLSKFFSAKKVRWGLPATFLFIGIPLLRKFNRNLCTNIYNHTIRKMSLTFNNRVVKPIIEGFQDKPFFKLYFFYD